MKKKGQKERLKPISLYGYDPRDVIRAFMQVSPKRLKDLEEEERRVTRLADQDGDEADR
jgi:CMP-2-keto-3-deoxyoctulosonic acid synthetase